MKKSGLDVGFAKTNPLRHFVPTKVAVYEYPLRGPLRNNLLGRIGRLHRHFAPIMVAWMVLSSGLR